MSAGVRPRWMTSDALRMEAVLWYLPLSLAASPMRMKMNALVMEAPAPVARVYVQQTVMQIIERIHTAFLPFPMSPRVLLTIPYMMPR